MNIEKAFSLITDKLQNWLEILVGMLPNVVLAFLVFFMIVGIGKVFRKYFRKYLGKISEKETLNKLLVSIIYTIILIIGVFTALNILNLEQTVTSLLAGAGIIGLALSFAFQDLATNFISGIMMAFKSPFRVGDIVETSGFTGIVESINLRSSVMRTFSGQLVHIPNKNIFQNSIINYTDLQKRRVEMMVGVSYDEDLDKVEKITLDTIRQLKFVRKEEPVEFYYENFGGSSIDFSLKFWVDFPGNTGFGTCRSEAIKAIKKVFDQHGISIPFPIRTLDFGIKGGEKLSEMLLHAENQNGN